jgi:predicted neutral ceramidase superfamily lipid hydrolase
MKLTITNFSLIITEYIYVLLLVITWKSKLQANWTPEITRAFIAILAITIGALIVLDIGKEQITLAVLLYYLQKMSKRGWVRHGFIFRMFYRNPGK